MTLETTLINIEARDRDRASLMPRPGAAYPELHEVRSAVDSLRPDDVAEAEKAATEAESEADRLDSILGDVGREM